jgi:UDP-N-acetyl-D-glucosamine dehydrogenase
MDNWINNLISNFEKKTGSISVFGLGYVGLPIAVVTAKNENMTVFALDIDTTKINSIKNNSSYIEDISDEKIKIANLNGMITTNNASEAIQNSDISIICVPTPVDSFGIPKLNFIYDVVEEIARALLKKKEKKHIIVLESTTYPTTTEIDVKNILEKYDLELHIHFELAFSPERIDPGNRKYSLENIPKLLGATSKTTFNLLKMYYEDIIGTKIVQASTPRVAEFTKLFENIFRQVNIALVNELATLAEKMQIDIFEVINLAATKPFGFLPHYPGPGLGGHCIPVDPYYLQYISKKYKSTLKFIDIASEINEGMDDHVLKLVNLALNRVNKSISGSKITLFGYSYKPNVSDLRNSPAIPISVKLRDLGSTVKICDKLVDNNKVDFPIVDEEYAINNSTLILIITPHSYFNWDQIISSLPEDLPVVDTRGVLTDKVYRKNDIALGRPIKEFAIE